MLNHIATACQSLLQSFPEAHSVQEYLDERLGSASQQAFQFGYFPSSQFVSVLIDLVGKQPLIDAHLIYPRDIQDALSPRQINHCYFEEYPLIIPFRDPYGKVLALVGRTLLTEKERGQKKIAKYKNTKPFLKGHNLFGLYENQQAIVEHNAVYIVEGQFDVITAVEKGVKNIVATGNNHLSTYQFSLITRYTNNIFLLLDNDDAGKTGRERAMSQFGKLANLRNFYLPDDFKDTGDFFSQHSASDFYQSLGVRD